LYPRELQLTAVLSDLNHMSRHYPAAEASQSTTDELTLLIRECLEQSRSAQKRLYDRFAPAAFGVIRRYMDNDTAVAQEILNDVFYKVFTKLSQYSFNGSFEGWIRRIAVNTIADHVKKNMKMKMSGKEMLNDDVIVECDSVNNISYKELLNLVQALPELQRIIFNLFVFENYSHKEIGQLLKINESNSRWYLNDARNKLKDKLNSFLK